MSYTTLQSDIISYTHRPDLVSVIPTLIANAEAMLFRAFGGVDFEVEISSTTIGNEITLPSNFMNVSRLVINDRTLDYHNGRADDLITVTASPSFFTVEDGKIIILPPVDTGTAYTLLYEAKLDPLSVSNTTNWLLDNAGDLYLWASVGEVGRYIRDDDLVAMSASMVGPLIESVNASIRRKKFPNRAGLQIRPRR